MAMYLLLCSSDNQMGMGILWIWISASRQVACILRPMISGKIPRVLARKHAVLVLICKARESSYSNSCITGPQNKHTHKTRGSGQGTAAPLPNFSVNSVSLWHHIYSAPRGPPSNLNLVLLPLKTFQMKDTVQTREISHCFHDHIIIQHTENAWTQTHTHTQKK